MLNYPLGNLAMLLLFSWRKSTTTIQLEVGENLLICARVVNKGAKTIYFFYKLNNKSNETAEKLLLCVSSVSTITQKSERRERIRNNVK